MKGIKDLVAVLTFAATALVVHVVQAAPNVDEGFEAAPALSAPAEPVACDEAVTPANLVQSLVEHI